MSKNHVHKPKGFGHPMTVQLKLGVINPPMHKHLCSKSSTQRGHLLKCTEWITLARCFRVKLPTFMTEAQVKVGGQRNWKRGIAGR